MNTTLHLQALGAETLYMESLYLNLKIEKALEGENFLRENLLAEAEALWKDINKEYHLFLDFLQRKSGIAA